MFPKSTKTGAIKLDFNPRCQGIDLIQRWGGNKTAKANKNLKIKRNQINVGDQNH